MSTLTYRMIAEIFRTAGDECVEFTDVKNSIKDRNLTGKVANIARNGRILVLLAVIAVISYLF